MALHPEVTVLNHAFVRILADKSRDFILDPVQDKLDAFVRDAQVMALGGERGAVGGHILHSHAFADETLRETYLDRYGWGAKPAAQCLLWKDATRVTNHILRHNVALDGLARSLPSLRFIMIVRNPIDIAISSIRKGYSAALVGEARKDNFADVFLHLIKLFGWFGQAARSNPDQFRFIYQDELLDPARLTALCGFLAIAADDAWLGDIAQLIRLRESYPVPDAQRAQMKAIIMRTIADQSVAQRVADQIA